MADPIRTAKQQSNDLYHRDIDLLNLISGLPVAIYTCNKVGIITFYNEAAAKLWGRRPEINKDLWCGSWKIYKTDGSNLSLDTCPMAITLKEGRALEGEEIIIERPDGVRVNVVVHPQPIFNSKGELNGAVNTLIDVTDKKNKEQRLRESEGKYRDFSESLERMVDERTRTLKLSEERYHKMIEEVQDYAILLLDKDGIILNWNKGAEKIKGYSEKDIVGKNFRNFYLPEDQEDNLPQKLIQIATQEGRAMQEGFRVRKNGEKFWGSIVITALHNSDGEVIGFSKVTRDLTERKEAEDKLKQYAVDIEFRNKQLEEYAYVASHDLQEPLRKIQVFSELLGKSLDDHSKIEHYIEKIRSSAKRMTTLIKDVLKYSQLSHTDEIATSIDLNKVLENAIEDFDLLIEQKNARIISNKLPRINGVALQLHQLFSNLIGNSLKFTEENPVIEINCEKAGKRETKEISQLKPESSYYKIELKDNGPGFPEEYASQIFELFKRLDPNKHGSGIGLPLCKKIVENHYGFIAVRSIPGSGSTFTIYFPLPEEK